MGAVITTWAILLMLGLVVACKGPTPPGTSGSPAKPKQVETWTGQQGILGEWGNSEDSIYALLEQWGRDPSILVVWKWKGNTIYEANVTKVPQGSEVIPAAGDFCGICPDQKTGPWPYALMSMVDGKILKEWETPTGWDITHAGASRNGQYIALLKEDGPYALGYEFQHDRRWVGVLDVAKQELKWVCQLLGSADGSIREIAITDDGRYIAIGGWGGGVMMVDGQTEKILWKIRPAGVVTTGIVQFTPDGESVYAVDTGGEAVTQMSRKDGAIMASYMATMSGKEENAARITAFARSNDGKWLAAGTGPKGEVYLWDLAHGGKVRSISHSDGGGCAVNIVGFSPDSSHVVSVGRGKLKVWALTP
jgi:hypothetical protein